MEAANNKLFYIGTTYPAFAPLVLDAQSEWITDILRGEEKLPSHEEMKLHSKQWVDK